MPETPQDVLALAQDNGARIVDLRFCDLPGLMQHFSIPVEELTEEGIESGYGFDGSSIRGFQAIHESDMLLMPDPTTAVMDPFREVPTLQMHCFVADPMTRASYSRDPRYIARKAEAHLRETGIADVSYWGPELEFYIFDGARFDQNQHEGYYHIESVEGVWASGQPGSRGYRPRYKEGYFPVPPMDQHQDLRSEMALTLMELGIPIEVQHHEVGTAGQAEMDMRFASLLAMADNVMNYKYVVKNVAWRAGKTATFMPKPVFADNGSGMHVHQSLWRNGQNLFYDEAGYAGLSDAGPALHRRAPRALARAAGVLRTDHQLLPPPGPRLRGADQPRLLAAQPLGLRSHPHVHAERQGEAPRVPPSRPHREPLPRLLRDAAGRPRRDPEQDRAAGPDRPGPLRTRARGGGIGQAGAGVTGSGPGRPGGGSRLPDSRAASSPTT